MKARSDREMCIDHVNCKGMSQILGVVQVGIVGVVDVVGLEAWNRVSNMPSFQDQERNVLGNSFQLLLPLLELLFRTFLRGIDGIVNSFPTWSCLQVRISPPVSRR